MELKDVSADKVTIAMGRDEVSFLCAAITEALNEVSDREFKIRTGETRARARDIWKQLINVLDEIRHPKAGSE